MTPRCDWCAGRGRVADHLCLACNGTGSDGTAWVAQLLGILPRSHRVVVEDENGGMVEIPDPFARSARGDADDAGNP